MQGYGLTLDAEEDLRGVWRYTFAKWGPDQADRYLGQMEACFEAISHDRAQSKSFETLPTGVCILRCEHHYIFWLTGERPIIVAVLHEKMDLVRRLKERM